MLKYVIKRILWIIPVLLGVVLIVFFISYISPGDPVMTMLGTANYTPEKYAALSAQYGLDKPFIVQYLNYIKNVVLHGDLGTSYTFGNSISGEIAVRGMFSIKLGFFSILLTVAMAIPLGVISATKQYSAIDYILTVISMFLAGMPNFWFALMLMLLFSVTLGWLPATGVGTFKQWIMPVFSLAVSSMASTLRMTRSSMLEVIRQDYVRTARAKGLSEGVITRKHILKNALIPVITVVGMHMGTIIGGSIVIETIFNMPGVGAYMMTAINNRDYPAINGCVLVLSLSVCIVNLLVDVLYAYVDPRIKVQYLAQQKKRKKKPAKAVEGANQ
jgi:peptide/nickel transport system permease protein